MKKAPEVTRLTVTMPKDLVEALQNAATSASYPVSVSQVVRTACEEHLRNKETGT